MIKLGLGIDDDEDEEENQEAPPPLEGADEDVEKLEEVD